MIRLMVVWIVLLLASQMRAQPSHSKRDYVNVVRNFYTFILSNTFVSMNKCTSLFGEDTGEIEEMLFFVNCDKRESFEECKKDGDAQFSNLDSAQSLVISELREGKAEFGILDSTELERMLKKAEIIDEGAPDNLFLVLSLSQASKIYFALNKYADEPIDINNIYLPNGESYLNEFFVEAVPFYQQHPDDGFSPLSAMDTLKLLGTVEERDGYVNARAGPSIEAAVVWKIRNDSVFYFTPNSQSKWWLARTIDGAHSGWVHSSRIVYLGRMPNDKRNFLRKQLEKLDE